MQDDLKRKEVKKMTPHYRRLIRATVELAAIAQNTKEDDTRYAAASGHNLIMDLMKEKDSSFCDEVIYQKSH